MTSDNQCADSAEAITEAGNGATDKPDSHTASAVSGATGDSAVPAADLPLAGTPSAGTYWQNHLRCCQPLLARSSHATEVGH